MADDETQSENEQEVEEPEEEQEEPEEQVDLGSVTHERTEPPVAPGIPSGGGREGDLAGQDNLTDKHPG